MVRVQIRYSALACVLVCLSFGVESCHGTLHVTTLTGDANTQGDQRTGDTITCAINPTLPGCGQTCERTDGCPVGMYCTTGGNCQSECVPGDDTPCSPGAVCTMYGYCVHDEPDPDNGVCVATVIEADFTIPTVMFLIDQSGSMDWDYVGGSRWDVLRHALTDPSTGVFPTREEMVRFGLTLYTNQGGPPCPDLTVVPPALDNFDAISDVYLNSDPEGGTPTGESIEEVIVDLAAFAEEGPKYIVLATDGEPNTCAVPGEQSGQPEAIAAAQNAYANGIPLFILSVGLGDVSLQHLQEMANAGAGLPISGPDNATYYEPGDQAQLATAFDEIIGRVLSCTVHVAGELQEEAASYGTVFLDGNPLVYDDPNGWAFVDTHTLEFRGLACDIIKEEGAHFVSIQIPCWEDPA